MAQQLSESFNTLDQEDDSSDELEDPVQRRERYIHSHMSEISDPEYWMDLHHGDDGLDASEAG